MLYKFSFYSAEAQSAAQDSANSAAGPPHGSTLRAARSSAFWDLPPGHLRAAGLWKETLLMCRPGPRTRFRYFERWGICPTSWYHKKNSWGSGAPTDSWGQHRDQSGWAKPGLSGLPKALSCFALTRPWKRGNEDKDVLCSLTPETEKKFCTASPSWAKPLAFPVVLSKTHKSRRKHRNTCWACTGIPCTLRQACSMRAFITDKDISSVHGHLPGDVSTRKSSPEITYDCREQHLAESLSWRNYSLGLTQHKEKEGLLPGTGVSVLWLTCCTRTRRRARQRLHQVLQELSCVPRRPGGSQRQNAPLVSHREVSCSQTVMLRKGIWFPGSCNIWKAHTTTASVWIICSPE